jgi:acetylglutamate kinase
MVAKIEACLLAMTKVPMTRIIDGRVPHALLDEFEGKGDGTTIGW